MRNNRTISLRGFSEVARLHRNEVKAPFVQRAENFYSSPSDNLPTLRGDIQRFRSDIYSVAGDFHSSATSAIDFLNTIISGQDTNGDIYITRYLPVGYNKEVLTTTYSTGTMTSDDTTTVNFSGTVLLGNVWPGCILVPNVTPYNLFEIVSIVSDTRVIVDNPVPLAVDVTYTIYRTHDSDRAWWPAHVEKMGDTYIYNVASPYEPTTTAQVDRISGPFYSMPSAFGAAEVFNYSFQSSLMPFGPDIVSTTTQLITCDFPKVYSGCFNAKVNVLTSTTGDRWSAISRVELDYQTDLVLRLCSANGKLFMISRKAIRVSSDGTSWTKVMEFPWAMSIGLQCTEVVYGDSTYYFLASTWNPSSGLYETRTYYSTDSTSWTAGSIYESMAAAPPSSEWAFNTLYGGASIMVLSAIHDGTRLVVTDEHLRIRYTTDSGVTWTQVTTMPASYGKIYIYWANSKYIINNGGTSDFYANNIHFCSRINGNGFLSHSASITSPSWTNVRTAFDFNDIKWLNSAYIMPGYASIRRSTDLAAFSIVYSPAWSGTPSLWQSVGGNDTLGEYAVIAPNVLSAYSLKKATTAYSTDGSTWSASDIRSGTYFNDLVVVEPDSESPLVSAVGDLGLVVMVTQKTSGISSELFACATDGASQFLVAGTSAAITSNRGTDFSLCTAPGFTVYGAEWTGTDSGTGGYYWCIVGSGGNVKTGDGITWTARTSNTTEKLNDICKHSSTLAVAVGENGTIISATTVAGPFTVRTSGTSEHLNSVDSDGTTIVAVGENGTILYSTDGTTWSTVSGVTTEDLKVVRYLGSYFYIGGTDGVLKRASDPTQAANWTTVSSILDNNTIVGLAKQDKYIWAACGNATRLAKIPYVDTTVPDFIPLSDRYRSQSFMIIGAYMVLIGTLELEDGTWKIHPRRIRWSVPGDFKDFQGYGSGVMDLNGTGYLLDGRVVQDIGIILSSNSLEAISWTGNADPEYGPIFSHRTISVGIKAISNPVVIDNTMYFINQNGLLTATQGMSADILETPFDLSEYMDVHSTTQVIQLVYNKDIRSLLCYSPSETDTDHPIFIINPSDGRYTRLTLPSSGTISDAGPGSEINYPFCIVQVATDYPLNPQAEVSFP